MPASAGFVPVEGGLIHYSTEGSGAPLVLLHGGRMDLSMWDAVVPQLAKAHRVVRWDARGHGGSTAQPGPSDPAEDLRRLLDHLGIGRATLVGFSMGAGTAVQFAVRHPQRVSRLVLISTAAPPPDAPRPPGFAPPLAQREGRRLLAGTGLKVLMIVGTRDSELIRSTGAAVAAEVPGAKLISLENAGHHVIADQPKAVASAIIRSGR